MAGTTTATNELPTIWRVPDTLWAKIQPVLAELDPPNTQGRKRIDQRGALAAIIFRWRAGCPWNHLPTEFPDDSSVQRPFQRCRTMAFSNTSGRGGYRNAPRWAAWTGRGRRRTRDWARPARVATGLAAIPPIAASTA